MTFEGNLKILNCVRPALRIINKCESVKPCMAVFCVPALSYRFGDMTSTMFLGDTVWWLYVCAAAFQH